MDGLTVVSVNAALNIPAIIPEDAVLMKEIDSLEIELRKLDQNTKEHRLLSEILSLKKELYEIKTRAKTLDSSSVTYKALSKRASDIENSIKNIEAALQEGNDPQEPYYDLSQITNFDTLNLAEGAKSEAWVVKLDGSISNIASSFGMVTSNKLLSCYHTVLIAEKNQSDPNDIDIKVYTTRVDYGSIAIELGEMTSSKGETLKTVSVDPTTAVLRLKTTITRNSNNSSQPAKSSA